MHDYNHRVIRYGKEVADKKMPSPFTLEIHEFMQEAKRACKSEHLEGVDYSRMRLVLDDATVISDVINMPDGIMKCYESDEELSTAW